MNSGTLTTKGQVTIPKRLRDYLGLLPGDKVGFEYTEDGAVRIVAPRRNGQGKGRRTSRFSALRGTRKTGMSTDEIMNLLRGYGDDAGDPGFKDRKFRMEVAMNRTRALELLTQSKPILAACYGVTQLALFGSIARNTARSDSDIDILVAFDGPATSERYFGVQFYLEDLFGCPVDLVTEKALRAELRPFIEKEAVHV